MSYDHASMPLSGKQITVIDSNRKFNFNHIVQRGLVWEQWRKSKLIESILKKVPVPQIYCRRDVDPEAKKKKGASTYVVMDGKQRITTISSFIRNEWKLTQLPPIKYLTLDLEEAEADVSGLTFDELPEELQDMIKDTSFSFIYFDDITPEEERELFDRLNSGKALSTKAKLLCHCLDLEHILAIGEHDLFKGMLTENSLSQKNHVMIIMKIWAMMNKDIKELNFSGNDFNKMVETGKISKDEEIKLLDTFDYIMSVHESLIGEGSREEKKIAKLFYTETHLVSLVPIIESARRLEISVDSFSEWISDFFTNTTEGIMMQYNEAVRIGSAKNANILTRNDILTSSYEDYFNINK